MKDEKLEIKPGNFFSKSFKWKLELSDLNKNEINTKISFSSKAFKKYFANTTWMFTEKIFRLLVAFFVGIYLVRYLGPEEFGLFSYALSFAGLFTIISTLGLDNIAVRELVKAPGRRDEILGTVFRLKIIGAVISIFLVTITAFLLQEPSFNFVLIVIITSSALFQSLNVIEYYFQAKVQSKYNVGAQSSSFFIASLLKVLLIITKQSLIWFSVVYASEMLLLSIGFFIVYKKNQLKISNWFFNKATAFNFMKDSWPLMLSGIVIAIYMKIDQVMIKVMLTVQDVGYYAVAVKLSEAWYFVPMAISASLFPAIINAKKISEHLYLNRLQKLYDLMALLSIGIAIPVTFFSNFIILILFGEVFSPATTVLTIYIWAGVATFLGVASSQYLISENLTKLSFFRTFIGMIVNVFLNLILIPTMGINGAAIATLLSYSIAVFSIYLDKKSRNQFFMMLKALTMINIILEIYNYGFNRKTKN